MKRTGAWIAVKALEALGIRYTFGIPGVHNTELYDELNSSEQITPVLVTHEGGASFMADGVSRTSDQTGTLVIVPAAGATHAASGIGEAFLDGIPMLVICGGIRTDLDKRYQLHELDQHAFLKPLTKASFLVTSHAEIVPTLFKAWEIARSASRDRCSSRSRSTSRCFPARCRTFRPHRPSPGRSGRLPAKSGVPPKCCWPQSSPACSSAGARATPSSRPGPSPSFCRRR
jgi:hypothetical protein